MFNLKIAMAQFSLLSLSLVTLAQAQIYRPQANLEIQYSLDTQGKSAQEVQQLSLKKYQEFVAIDVNSDDWNVHYNRDDKKPQVINTATANKVLDAASSNPVVSLYQHKKYDPNDYGTGFCFGRAMFVDLYLATNGLNRGSIKKAFVVGPMSSGGKIVWGWHVSTIVQSKNSAGKEIWIAVDPIVGDALEVTAWYKHMLRMSTNGKLRLYITESGKFSQLSYSYDYNNFNHPSYYRYFTDMLDWFHANDVSRELGLQ